MTQKEQKILKCFLDWGMNSIPFLKAIDDLVFVSKMHNSTITKNQAKVMILKWADDGKLKIVISK